MNELWPDGKLFVSLVILFISYKVHYSRQTHKNIDQNEQICNHTPPSVNLLTNPTLSIVNETSRFWDNLFQHSNTAYLSN